MAYTVAQAEVDVLPNARGFGEKLRALIVPEAERIGREAGDKIGDSIRDRVRVALERLPDANIDLDLDTTGATAEVDAFLADTKVKAAAAGDDAGRSLGDNMAGGFRARSALIGTAVGLGLAAGAPLAVAGAGVLFGGLAAVILHNNEDVQRSATALGTSVSQAYGSVATNVVPMLTSALGQIQRAAVSLAPAIGQVFNNLGPAIQGVTDGVIGLVRNALPGLAAAIQQGTPVFQGLASFMEKIGTGISNLFTIISAHAGAAGATFSAFGDIISSLLSVIGEFVSAGAELGQTVLPLIASAFGALAESLHIIQPILPAIVAGLLGFKAVGLLSGPLEMLSARLQTVAADGGKLTTSLAGNAASAVSKLGAALPVVGIAIGAVTTVIAQSEQRVNDWAAALLHGGEAARQAQQEMAAGPSFWAKLSAEISGNAAGVIAAAGAADLAQQSYKDLLAAMSPLERAQALATKAQNDLQDALRRHDTEGATDALSRYNIHTAEAARLQAELDAKLNGTSVAIEENKQRLQGLANVTSAANTAVNLLKEGLDALSGKAVSLGDAQVAVTQATANAVAALDGQRDANGNLTSALADTNGHLNQQTEAGAAAWQALTQLKDADNTLIATMEQHGATAGEVTAKDAELRQSFIDTAMKMGFSASEANNLANQILGIPEKRNTEITADTAQATAAAQALKEKIDAIRSKTVDIYINGVLTGQHVAGLNGGPGGTQLANARGNIVHAFASGGFESMQGGVAQIVPPQTMRIIGDRITDDEAYIPINDSARSLEILAQTANRMNFDLAPSGTGGVAGGGASSPSRVPALHVERYYEASGSSARETAEQLAWMARTRA